MSMNKCMVDEVPSGRYMKCGPSGERILDISPTHSIHPDHGLVFHTSPASADDAPVLVPVQYSRTVFSLSPRPAHIDDPDARLSVACDIEFLLGLEHPSERQIMLNQKPRKRLHTPVSLRHLLACFEEDVFPILTCKQCGKLSPSEVVMNPNDENSFPPKAISYSCATCGSFLQVSVKLIHLGADYCLIPPLGLIVFRDFAFQPQMKYDDDVTNEKEKEFRSLFAWIRLCPPLIDLGHGYVLIAEDVSAFDHISLFHVPHLCFEGKLINPMDRQCVIRRHIVIDPKMALLSSSLTSQSSSRSEGRRYVFIVRGNANDLWFEGEILENERRIAKFAKVTPENGTGFWWTKVQIVDGFIKHLDLDHQDCLNLPPIEKLLLALMSVSRIYVKRGLVSLLSLQSRRGSFGRVLDPKFPDVREVGEALLPSFLTTLPARNLCENSPDLSSLERAICDAVWCTARKETCLLNRLSDDVIEHGILGFLICGTEIVFQIFPELKEMAPFGDNLKYKRKWDQEPNKPSDGEIPSWDYDGFQFLPPPVTDFPEFPDFEWPDATATEGLNLGDLGSFDFAEGTGGTAFQLDYSPANFAAWNPPVLPPVPTRILAKVLHKPYPIFRSVVREALGEEWIETIAGPTSVSNWLIPCSLLITENPGDHSDDDFRALLFDSNVSLFVNLMPESTWQGHGVPYRRRVHQILSEEKGRAVQGVHFFESGIANVTAPSVEQATLLVRRIVSELRSGGVVAIHCRSGCGRAGTIGADVLGEIYPSMLVSEALARVQAGYNARKLYIGCRPWPSPESRLQRLHIAEFFGVERIDIENLLPGRTETEMRRIGPLLPKKMPLPNREYYIRSRANSEGFVMGILAEDLASDFEQIAIPVRQVPKDPKLGVFRLVLNTDDGTFSLLHVATGLMVDIAGRETDLGALVQLWKSDGSSSQRFYVSPKVLFLGSGEDPVDDDGWMITAQCSSMCLEAKKAGLMVHQWPIENKVEAQMWYFDQVEELD